MTKMPSGERRGAVNLLSAGYKHTKRTPSGKRRCERHGNNKRYVQTVVIEVKLVLICG
jgi:hypothetical protein